MVAAPTARSLRTASLPLDPDPRTVRIAGNVFVFTGTGVFGTRRMMQDATVKAGGRGGTKHHDADQLPSPRNVRHACMGPSEFRAEDREGDGLPQPKGNKASDRAMNRTGRKRYSGSGTEWPDCNLTGWVAMPHAATSERFACVLRFRQLRANPSVAVLRQQDRQSCQAGICPGQVTTGSGHREGE